MHRTLLLSSYLCFIVALPNTGSARIGEKHLDCLYRYGKPLNTDHNKNTYLFQKSGFLIQITLYGKKYEETACAIVYQKAERDILDNPAPLSDKEVELLMQLNGGELKWKKLPIILMNKAWET